MQICPIFLRQKFVIIMLSILQNTKTMTNFQQFCQTIIQQLEKDIVEFITKKQLPEPLNTATLYAMTNGGKRVRPLLLASSYHTIIQQKFENLTPIENLPAVRLSMLAVEMLHGYSLVHDDLPCMDDDELRRGKPTTHIKFGEATALLAGDVLQNLAFETFCEQTFAENWRIGNDLLQTFTPRARRMIMGQMLDLKGEKTVLTQHELEAIHKDKTGALIEASVLMGGICANASEQQLSALSIFAKNIGLAFQVQDDILDVIGNTEQLGKPVGSDEKSDKSTYVKLLGVENAKTYAESLFNNAKNAVVDEFGENNYLIDLLNWLWQRQK